MSDYAYPANDALLEWTNLSTPAAEPEPTASIYVLSGVISPDTPDKQHVFALFASLVECEESYWQCKKIYSNAAHLNITGIAGVPYADVNRIVDYYYENVRW